MGKGRKKIPTRIKILKGAQKCRINLLEPKFKLSDNTPPKFLDEIAKKEWLRVWPEVKDFITKVDRVTLAAYCVAFSRWLIADNKIQKESELLITTPNGMVQQSPFVAMARNWMQLMVKIASELGFTPASRSKVSTGKKADPDADHLFKK